MTPTERRDALIATLTEADEAYVCQAHNADSQSWFGIAADALMPKVEEWLAEYAADALEGVMHEVSYDVDAQLLARRADQWRAQATDRRSTP